MGFQGITYLKGMMNRRQLLQNGLLGVGALALGQAVQTTAHVATGLAAEFQHSACRWCYNDVPLETLCERGQDIGLKSIELLGPDEWPVVQRHGLTCAVGNAPFISLTEGFNDRRHHARLQEGYFPLLRRAAEAGIPLIICFSGNRRGMRDDRGMDHCARGLAPIVAEAERLGIVMVMEMLNSKVSHPDYMADTTAWAVALADKIGSPNFKLLYDIFHMQIMEGDIISTIREFHPYIAHYHTGGVPGRHEINDTQELNYPAIIRAIVETGFRGYVGQEFVPTYADKLAALQEGLNICTV